MKTYILSFLLAISTTITAAPASELDERQGAFGSHIRSTERVGNGSPRQAYFYQQVTPSAHCGGKDESCSMSNTEVESTSIGFSMSLAVGHPKSPAWGSAGFDVSRTKSVGFTTNCNAGVGDSTASVVCVWARIAHTGYESQVWEHYPAEPAENGEKIEDPFWIWSPNSNDGHDYVCAHDDECWGEGEEWWGRESLWDTVFDHEENKSGPTSWVWGPDPANRWN